MVPIQQPELLCSTQPGVACPSNSRCRRHRSSLGRPGTDQAPSWRSSFLGDPGAEFLCGKPGIGKKKERPVGTVGGNKSPKGGANGSNENGVRGNKQSADAPVQRPTFVQHRRGYRMVARVRR